VSNSKTIALATKSLHCLHSAFHQRLTANPGDTRHLLARAPYGLGELAEAVEPMTTVRDTDRDAAALFDVRAHRQPTYGITRQTVGAWRASSPRDRSRILTACSPPVHNARTADHLAMLTRGGRP
jgi:hypothetical protein